MVADSWRKKENRALKNHNHTMQREGMDEHIFYSQEEEIAHSILTTA